MLRACAQFKEISAAYEVLSDPEKRQIYDEYGEDALKEGGPGGMGGMGGNPFDIFENLFGGHPFGACRPLPPRSRRSRAPRAPWRQQRRRQRRR